MKSKVLHIDADHNGSAAIVQRYLNLGVPAAVLSDLDRFRFVEPEDYQHVLDVVKDAVLWGPDLVIIDSVGELVPMFGGDSNDPDSFTVVNRRVMTTLAKTGAAVVSIDHTPKDAATKLPTGTLAKMRVVSGVALRVDVLEAFAPGAGGKAYLTVMKDRPGGVRKHCPRDDVNPSAGVFELVANDFSDDLQAVIHGPGQRDRAAENQGLDVMILANLDRLDPPPKSVADLKNRMGWGTDKAADAMRAWRDREASQAGRTSVPGGGGSAYPVRPIHAQNPDSDDQPGTDSGTDSGTPERPPDPQCSRCQAGLWHHESRARGICAACHKTEQRTIS